MAEKSSGISQIISLPKGGGAMHGIGEKFAPDLHTGTGNFTVPIALPPGRNGFQPQLNLVYSTGNGNGYFGLGWGLSVPGVSRKTSKGIPQYDDLKDVFILSGAEDLVRIERPDGSISYRPRTEGLFAQITHHRSGADNYWEVKSKDGLTSFYGTNPTPNESPDYPQDWPQISGDPAVITKPQRPSDLFAWKLTLTKDAFGNRIEYLYERDQSGNRIDTNVHQWDQPLLKTIRYIDVGDSATPDFLVWIKFDYDEEKPEDERPDSFSDYRAGFEIRTSKRCRAIEIETHTGPGIINKVRRYEFNYRNDALNRASLLTSVQLIGFDQSGNEDRGMPPLEFNYSRFEPQGRKFFPVAGHDLPPASLANPNYELVDIFGNGLPDVLEMNGTVRYWRNLGNGQFDLPHMMKDAPPFSLAETGVQMIDANGDGRADLLITNGTVAGYFPLNFDGGWDRKSLRRYDVVPSFSLEDPEVRLVDLDGDGVTDAIRAGTRLECYFNDPHKGWSANRTRWVPRQSLDVFPNVNFSDPRVKWADMTGDQMQDIVLVYDGNVEYWPNLGYGNWGKRIHMANSPRFPYGYDPRRILAGDVDGDGLADIVYVDDRKVTLWINQSGNGWSNPIVIHGTPPVNDLDSIRLTDLLGNGVSGVLWSSDVGGMQRHSMYFLDFTGGVKPYVMNEMNNNIGALTRVEYKPSTYYYLQDRKLPQTRWRTTLPLPVQVVSRVEVIDQVSGGKLTTEYKYHHGYWDGEEREFRGFGMVEQLDTEVFDDYHRTGLHDEDAKFIPVQRRQFSPPMLTKTWFHQGPVENESGEWRELDWNKEYWQDDPQLLQHTVGVNRFLQNECIDRRMRRDALRVLRGSILRTELYALDGSNREARPYTVSEHAYSLREEEKLADNSRQHIFFPFSVAQRTTQWERGEDPLTQFSFTAEYDTFGQPQLQTALAMPRRSKYRIPRRAGVAVDDQEKMLASCSVTRYAQPPANVYIHDRPALATSFEWTGASIVNEQDAQNVQRVLQDQYAAATTIKQACVSSLKDWGQVNNWAASSPIPANLKVITNTINRYDGRAYDGLNVGTIGQYGVLSKSESLVFDDDRLDEAYGPLRPSYLGGTAALPLATPAGFGSKTGYHQNQAAGYLPGYYAITKQQQYDFQTSAADLTAIGLQKAHGLVIGMRDPLDNEASIRAFKYELLPVTVIDPLNLTTTASYEDRFLQPTMVTDQNENRSIVHYTPLGLVRSIAVTGKQLNVGPEHVGDRFKENRIENGQRKVAVDYPSQIFTYDFLAVKETRGPISVRTSKRIEHFWDDIAGLTDAEIANAYPRENAATPQKPDAVNEDIIRQEIARYPERFIQSAEYSDGFGRLIQTRSQAEEETFGHEMFGDGVLTSQQGNNRADNQPIVGRKNTDPANPNVVVSGWQVYDNKGRVVEKFESFFSTGWQFDEATDQQKGQKAEMFYDPRGQVIRTLNPDGSEQRVIYGVPGTIDAPDLRRIGRDKFEPTPWEAYTYDPNDLAEVSFDPIRKKADGTPETLKNRAPVSHYYTPSSILIDALGRTIRAIERNGDTPSTDWYVTRSEYDIQGNLINIFDPLGRRAFHHTYDFLKRPLRVESLDAGLRMTVQDAAGNVIEQRDGKGAIILHIYDAGNRPKELWAQNGAGQEFTRREVLIYGDDAEANLANAKERNQLGKLYRHFDEAGQLTFDQYDFKGNPLEKYRAVFSDATIATNLSARQPGRQIKTFLTNWRSPAGTALDIFADTLLDTPCQTSVSYDALNRVKVMIYPEDVDGDRRRLRPQYNRAGALQSVSLEAGGQQQEFVRRIAYNAKGQRTMILYGNRVMTRYAYDPQTFRLARMRTEGYSITRTQTIQPNGNRRLQDFAYEYDLAGNIIKITDVTPGCGVRNNPEALNFPNHLQAAIAAGDVLIRRFEYDPIYRLISATGRESRNISSQSPWEDRPREGFNWGNPGTASPENARDVTQVYTEQYEYDPAGNMLRMNHGTWSRYFGMGGFRADEWETLITQFQSGQPMNWGHQGNRLTHFGNSDNVPQSHRFDENGNLIQENTERHFAWDYGDRMIGFANNARRTPSVEACYLYDSTGQRVKKYVRKQGGINETVYIDSAFEYHSEGSIENNTLHIMDNQSRVALVRVGKPFPDDGAPNVPVKYHLGDHLGSSNFVIGGPDSLGNTFINLEEYFAYGETSFGGFAKKRYRYSSKGRDEENGLYYYGARYHAAWLGRWTSPDPAGLVDGTNLFLYVLDNPIRFADPNGHQSAPLSASAAKVESDEKNYYVSHVYSTAPEAKEKKKLDLEIMGGDFSKGKSVDMHNEKYLKELIRRASKDSITVKTDAKGLQFFIIKGGGEGFLDASFRSSDASNVTIAAPTTDGKPGTVMKFDNNDLIAVFDAKGSLISSALMRRPLSIKNPNIWTEKTANKVYESWDNRSVSLYENRNFDIKYFGLRVDDALGYYKSGKVRIDMHKQEATNGCIFIVDQNTPPLSEKTKLNAFEPKFIEDVAKNVGKERANIGTMRMVSIN